MTENGLKEGDWAKVKGSGVVGVVTLTDKDDDSLVAVELPHRSIVARSSESLERIDRRTAFLSELKGLLERYDACIWPCGHEVDGLCIYFNASKDEIRYDMDDYSPIHELNADNIMDFEKD